jgi:aspartyl aminopeptidase
VDIDRDLLLIPNLAIHMNRSANDNQKWNPAVDTLPILGGKDAKGKLAALLEQEAGGKILGHDLYLYTRQKASVWGIDEEYLSSAALDDLECAWSCTQGFLNAQNSESIPVLCVFDCEEVGSSSVQGAASDLLEGVLTRICGALKLDIYQMLANSFMVSADNGHALHPNHPEMSDAANAPLPGGGVVLKFNASQRYCTDGVAAAIFRKVCAKADVQTQTYCNRADIPGGSTLGNISLHHVSVPTADIGLAQLAMHSCYETGAVIDAIALEKAMADFYGSTLTATDAGYTLK